MPATPPKKKRRTTLKASKGAKECTSGSQLNLFGDCYMHIFKKNIFISKDKIKEGGLTKFIPHPFILPTHLSSDIEKVSNLQIYHPDDGSIIHAEPYMYAGYFYTQINVDEHMESLVSLHNKLFIGDDIKEKCNVDLANKFYVRKIRPELVKASKSNSISLFGSKLIDYQDRLNNVIHKHNDVCIRGSGD